MSCQSNTISTEIILRLQQFGSVCGVGGGEWTDYHQLKLNWLLEESLIECSDLNVKVMGWCGGISISLLRIRDYDHKLESDVLVTSIS